VAGITHRPTFVLPATWVDASLNEELRLKGYTVVCCRDRALDASHRERLNTNMSDLFS